MPVYSGLNIGGWTPGGGYGSDSGAQTGNVRGRAGQRGTVRRRGVSATEPDITKEQQELQARQKASQTALKPIPAEGRPVVPSLPKTTAPAVTTATPGAFQPGPAKGPKADPLAGTQRVGAAPGEPQREPGEPQRDDSPAEPITEAPRQINQPDVAVGAQDAKLQSAIVPRSASYDTPSDETLGGDEDPCANIESLADRRICEILNADYEDEARRAASRAMSGAMAAAGRGRMTTSGGMLALGADVQQKASDEARRNMFGDWIQAAGMEGERRRLEDAIGSRETGQLLSALMAAKDLDILSDPEETREFLRALGFSEEAIAKSGVFANALNNDDGGDGGDGEGDGPVWGDLTTLGERTRFIASNVEGISGNNAGNYADSGYQYSASDYYANVGLRQNDDGEWLNNAYDTREPGLVVGSAQQLPPGAKQEMATSWAPFIEEAPSTTEINNVPHHKYIYTMPNGERLIFYVKA